MIFIRLGYNTVLLLVVVVVVVVVIVVVVAQNIFDVLFKYLHQ